MDLFEKMLKGKINESQYLDVIEGRTATIGSRVEVIDRAFVTNSHIKLGMRGTIVGMSDTNKTCAVEYDERFAGGHDCEGKAEWGHGWWSSVNAFKVIQDET